MSVVATDIATNSVFLRHLQQLLQHLAANHTRSLYQQAMLFFRNIEKEQRQCLQLEALWQQTQQPEARKAYLSAQYQAETLRLNRLSSFTLLAEQILLMANGNTRPETLSRSARVLGSLQLMVPTSKSRWHSVQYGYKPLYKAVLALRLLDQLLEKKLINDPYIQQHYQNRQQGADAVMALCPFRYQVQLPLVMAVLLQDIGQLHPDAKTILRGDPAVLDPMRQLTADERKRLLHYCQQANELLVIQGLGTAPYRGNNKNERDKHQAEQQERQDFLLRLLQQATITGTHLGNLLKIPQVYASIVLPGRHRFNYESLPKAALLLREGVKRNLYDAKMVNQLLRITGIFPQGYGVVFCPLNHDGKPQEKYEFAIVNQLYPPKAEQPLCRQVSRNQQYRNTAINVELAVENNLYFRPARDRLSVLPEPRLKQLLNQLYTDGENHYLRKMLPRCWQPEHFFSHPDHQSLWQNAVLKQN